MALLRHVVFDLTIAIVLFAATGCLISTSNSVRESGTPVRSATLKQVEVGTTTESWLLATLGPPTARCKVADEPGVEILSYDHGIVKTSHGHVFLLFSGNHKDVSSHKTRFEITDGVVSRYWTEG